MRHPLAALSAGVLIAVSLAARADDPPKGPALARESGPAAGQSHLEKAPPRPAPITGPLPVGVEVDVYCSGYLGDNDEAFVGRIVNAEKERNQSMFLWATSCTSTSAARTACRPGWSSRSSGPSHLVNRWGSEREVWGRVYMTPGRVRVICAQEKASIVEIIYSCNEVEVGDFVAPFEPVPVPLVRRTRPATICDTPNGKAIGHIVATRDAVTPVGTDTVVFLDLGEQDGLNPGDFLTVYHPSTQAVGVRTVLGEAAILTTRNRTSVAIITSMVDFIAVGDAVELK